MLERVEHIWIDGEDQPSIVGTGTEDYCSGGWYYALGRNTSPTHGCLVRDWARGRVSAYRYDVASPVPFRESIRVAIDHGIDNVIATDYSSVAYWYQAEPHRPFAPMPPPKERRHNTWLSSAVQTTAAVTPLGSCVHLGRPAVARPERWWVTAR